MSNPTSELNTAILRYICECQVNGDFMALRALGLPNEILDKLRSMTVQEILHTSSMGATFIKSLQIDSVILSNLLSRANEESRSQYILNQLVALEAPLQLVRQLRGVSALEFSTMRKLQNIEVRGRTQLATVEEERQIFDTCRKLGLDAAQPETLSDEDWVRLAQHTGLPIRIIYKVICDSEVDYEHAN